VTLSRGIDGSDPARGDRIGRLAGTQEERRVARSSVLAAGTLACPRCDAPVALPAERVAPADRIACPYCAHAAHVRDFLSLEAPTRPARVVVRVVLPAAQPSVSA
jgi:hypothetical protein